MSDAAKAYLDILLPEADIAVFSQDPHTLETAKNLSKDWRFARVLIHTIEGNVETACTHFETAPSPDLIILQTENMDESLTEDLENLAEFCHEDTAAIIIGPVNDVTLYRKLIDMGVSDYLVKPVDEKVLGDVIAKTLIERLGVTDSRLIAFTGAKGGVGTTVLSEAAAHLTADILGQKTILLDLAGGRSTLGVGMGFDPATTLHETAKAALNHDEDNLVRMLHKSGEKLDVIAGGGDSALEPFISREHAESLIDFLMSKYPVVIADLSGTSPELAKAVLGRAHHIMLISTPQVPALRLTRALLQDLKDLRGGQTGSVDMIINMSKAAPAGEIPKKDIEEAVGLKVETEIPFLPKVFMQAESESKPAASIKEGAQIIEATLKPLLARIIKANEATEDKKEAQSNVFGYIKSVFKGGS